jgi:ATP-dependent DNA helicase, RecQ family
MDLFANVLKEYWGYPGFRPGQEDIIRQAYEGGDLLALMPTGGGKSICFQVPALLRPGICLVVTPLIALMKDQVENLKARKIKALSIHSGMSQREIDITLDNAVYGDYKFLYLSPERLHTEIFQARLVKMQVSLIVVDEAHCISQWGYDFRPAYLEIASLRALLPQTPMMALTATATPIVAKDIMEKLQMREPRLFQNSFERKNIAYVVREVEDKLGQMLRIAQGIPGTGIVYVRERKKTEDISKYLCTNGIEADAYHAGMSGEMRSAKQEAWKNGKTRIIVSTNAFGMGIDKADVRFVCHYDVPESVEAYFQEAGRGGRDEQKSFAVLLYNKSDAKRIQQIFKLSFPEIAYIRKIYQHVFTFFEMAYGEGKDQVRDFNLQEFSQRYKLLPSAAYHALLCLEQEGYFCLSDEAEHPARIHFSVSRDDLYGVQLKSLELDRFIKLLLRSYTGLFSGFVPIDEEWLARRYQSSAAVVKDFLIRLSRLHLLHYIPQKRTPQIYFQQERFENNNMSFSVSSYEERKKRYRQRLDAMLGYAQSSEPCRSRQLLAHFGEDQARDCGICDVCLRKNAQNGPSALDRFRGEILSRLSQGPVPVQALIPLFDRDPEQIKDLLRWMVEEGDILYAENGMVSLV